MSVAVPLLVPSSTTLTKGAGSEEPSIVTVPVIVSCANINAGKKENISRNILL